MKDAPGLTFTPAELAALAQGPTILAAALAYIDMKIAACAAELEEVRTHLQYLELERQQIVDEEAAAAARRQ